jgi:hypothetical protein
MTEEMGYVGPEIARMRAWRVCINDARKYIALARQIQQFIGMESSFEYNGGTAPVAFIVEKCLLSSAVMSAGQLLMSGYGSGSVASNKSTKMSDLLEKLYLESDSRNAWEKGTSKEIFEIFVRGLRDGFLAHYDGTKSEYHESVDASDGSLLIIWKPPNPVLEVSEFSDLEKALYQMENALNVVFYSNRVGLSPWGSA